MRKVVITGGAGYIGRHVYLALVAAGYTPVIFDLFKGANRSVLNQLHFILGKPIIAQHIDLMDVAALKDAMRLHQPSAVIHLATPQRMHLPYGTGNSIIGAKGTDEHIWMGSSVIKAMQAVGCSTLILASSHQVYANEPTGIRREHDPTAWSHTAGFAHLALEDICDALTNSHHGWRIGTMRLFDVAGAHNSACLGPALAHPTLNWLVELCHAANGRLPNACVPGHNLPTTDGSPVRDFVHVQDVAQAFTMALDAIDLYGESFVVNIGTGVPTSLIESVQCFEQVCGKAVKTRFIDHDPTASHSSVANISLAKELLSWQPQYTLANMCTDTWGWYEAYMHKRLPV